MQIDNDYTKQRTRRGDDRGYRKHLSYAERVESLGLSRLTTWRVRSDLIQTFKIINGIDKVDKGLFYEFASGCRRGHSSKLFLKRSRLDIRKYTFSNQIGIPYRKIVLIALHLKGTFINTWNRKTLL